MAMYKQKCIRCKKNYVMVVGNQKFPMCYDCQKGELHKPVKDPKMKKLFNIPEELYKQNLFLRSIKLNYLRFGRLTEKQIEAFKRTVQNMTKKQQKT